MYCIKCGVELAQGQEICPVCNTRVYHPDVPVAKVAPTYPKRAIPPEEVSRKGLMFVITILSFLLLVLPMLFEFLWHRSVLWSGYVAGGVLLLYIWAILPCWFRRPNPVIFVPCSFAAATLYLLYVNLQTGGKWFLLFALPISASLALIVTAMVALHYYLRRGLLYIFGGGLIALGAWTVLIELLVWLTFSYTAPVHWSFCSFLTLLVIGLMLIIIAIVKPLKESLYKIFFIG